MRYVKRLTPRDWWEGLAMVAIIAIIAAGGLIVNWLYFQDNPPLVVNNEPLPLVLDRETYAPGDRIIFGLDFCRRSTGAIHLTRRWIDGIMYIEPEESITGGNRECAKRNIFATVPDIPPGIYHLEYHVSYEVNPLATRLVTFRTVDFEIAGE